MKKVFLVLIIVVAGMLYLSSCYNNKYDILSLPQVSFVKEVVPIATSGACGCHNFSTTGEAKFSNGKDTIYYDAIYGVSGVLAKWAKDSVSHPGGGSVTLSARDKQVINAWVAQGKPNDYTPPAITGTITYTNHILPSVVNSICNSCHGKSAPTLSYTLLSSSSGVNILTKMANSDGTIGHPGGVVPLSSSISKLILDWITQGTKQ